LNKESAWTNELNFAEDHKYRTIDQNVSYHLNFRVEKQLDQN